MEVEHKATLEAAASLAELHAAEVELALCSHTLEVRGERLLVQHSVEQASRLRDALVTTAYCNLFGYLTSAVNRSMQVAAVTDGFPPGAEEDSFVIGILDLFGFECFDTNSLEQVTSSGGGVRLDVA